jgi:hypothetical protein
MAALHQRTTSSDSSLESPQFSHRKASFRRPQDRQYYSYLSGRSGFAIYLGRRGTLLEHERSGGQLRLADKDTVIQHLFAIVNNAGYVVRTVEPTDGEDTPGYQLSASAMRWLAGDAASTFHDPILCPTHHRTAVRPTCSSSTSTGRAAVLITVVSEGDTHDRRNPQSVRGDRCQGRFNSWRGR